jgi:hypothetical protein
MQWLGDGGKRFGEEESCRNVILEKERNKDVISQHLGQNEG